MNLFQVCLLSLFLSLFFGAIIFHEDLIYYVGRKLCKRGNHWFKKRKYHCSRCRATRDWPKLVCIQGDKKDKLIFPKI